MGTKKLPKFLKKYFWDVDFEKLIFSEYKNFILKCLLERGDLKAINWLSTYYTKEDIKNLILTLKDLSPKTANFWALYLGVDLKKVPSLQKPYLPRLPIPLSSWYLNYKLEG